jgi:4-amino-4-deoxy-L-arabinose transferase-like glycosyltransferase
VRIGYLETRFAPVISTGKTPPEERRYYLTHPPLIGISVSLAFHLFGEHEWAARLVPLLFGLGSIPLVYRLGSKVFSRETGLVAAALYSFAPLDTLYGAHVDPQGPPVTFFALLLLVAYEEGRPLVAAGALLLGAGFDWPIHYLSGLLALHALLFRPDRRRWAIGLLAASLLLVGAFLLYARFVAPQPRQQYLQSTPVDSFLFWSGVRVPPGRIPGRPLSTPTPAEWFVRMARHLDFLYTLPLLALAAFGAVSGARARWSTPPALLLPWGLAHILLFPLGAFVHDYWSMYLSPGLALAAASGLVRIADRLRTRRTLLLAASSAALSLFLLAMGIHRVDSLPREPAALGRRIHGLTRPDEGVLMLNPLDARDAYYADRVIRDGVNRLALFEKALRGSVRYRYFVVPAQIYRNRPKKPLFTVVSACCRSYAFEDYYFFDLEPLTSTLRPP